MVTAVAYVADDMIERQPQDTHDAQVAVMGMVLLRDHLRRVLDFTDLATQEPPGPDVLLLADAFCREHCPCSRVGPPGDHPLCEGCPLFPVTVGLEAQQVAETTTEED